MKIEVTKPKPDTNNNLFLSTEGMREIFIATVLDGEYKNFTGYGDTENEALRKLADAIEEEN